MHPRALTALTNKFILPTDATRHLCPATTAYTHTKLALHMYAFGLFVTTGHSSEYVFGEFDCGKE